MPYIGTINYRLAGNLFSNQYYLPDAELADGVTSFQAIITAMAALQTADVEYVSAALTDQLAPYATHPVSILNANGGSPAPTMPAITFLEFVFYPLANRGKTTHKIRGCTASDITDLSVWNSFSTGRGDVDGGGGGGVVTSVYAAFESVIGNLTVDRNAQTLVGSGRVSIGSKRATRRL